MGAEIICPICQFANIPADGARCPQCDADLNCFKVIDSLPDQLPAENSGSVRPLWPFLWLGLFICVTAAIFVFQYHFYERLEARIMEGQDRIIASLTRQAIAPPPTTAKDNGNMGAPVPDPEIVTDDGGANPGANNGPEQPDINKDKPEQRPLVEGGEEHKAKDEAGKLNAAADEAAGITPPSGRAGGDAAGQQPDRFWIYHANENDTLWGISERYYGHGRYYPVILEHNPGVGIFEIGGRTTLRMVNDRNAAKKLLAGITERKGQRLFWRYTVTGGDTLRTIARKFYRKEDQTQLVTDLNQGIEIKPGERVKIALE